MKDIFRHYAIIYWSKKAKKYNDLVNMYVKDIEGIDYIYATGLMAVSRDSCLSMVEKLEKRKNK